ncbi:MAG: hypothetical protein JWO62_1173 [Acidimicrobiaceae bacterium]|nr:hypothetical protein [Acidimicrobiaceae bacterium]
MSSRRWRSVAAALLALTAASCNGSSTPKAQPTPSDNASASSTADPNALASDSALAAYRGFRRAQVAAEAVANAHDPALAKYAGDKALAQERANLLQLASAGIVVRGAPVLHPVVDSASPQAVTITDCVDTTGWQPVYKATGKSAAAPGQPTTVLATALARPYGDGWLIVELTTERSRPC